MNAQPEYSSRRANVIAGLAAAIVGMAMIAIAGKASAEQPTATHAQHAHPTHAQPAPQAQPQRKSSESTTDAEHHDAHVHAEYATPASTQADKPTTEHDSHPRPARN